MGFLARAVAVNEAKSVSFDKLWDLMTVGAKSKAGPAVTKDTVFKVSAALACMRAIAQGCTIPLKLLQETGDGEQKRRRVARDHAAYNVVTTKPNGWQTGVEFMETFVLHATLGNGYAYKNIAGGKLHSLILLHPGRVKPVQNDDWSITYEVTGKDGTTEPVSQELIWHLRGPSWDGFLGMDILNLARDALGLSMALEDSVASLHANGVRPTGLYSVEASLDDTQRARITNWLKKQAAAGAGTPMVLDRGAKWVQQTMTSVDAQTREQRQHQIEEICRFFGILPIVIGYSGDKANTYASAEAMFTAHRVFGMDPWYRRIQASADVNLLTEKDRKAGFYWKFTVNALLHAVAKDQGEYFSKALGSGGSPAWMAQDEVRDLLDMDPMGGGAGKLPVATNVPQPPAAGNNP